MNSPLLLSVDQARRLVADPPVGRGSAYALVRSGEWESVRIGRRVLVLRDSVERWVREAARNGGELGAP